jgi:hypothetical protein
MSLSLRDALCATNNGKAIVVQAETFSVEAKAKAEAERQAKEEARAKAEAERQAKAAAWDERVKQIKSLLHETLVEKLPRGYSRQWGWDLYKAASKLPTFVAADSDSVTEEICQCIKFMLLDPAASQEFKMWLADPVKYAKENREVEIPEMVVTVPASRAEKLISMLSIVGEVFVQAKPTPKKARDAHGRFLPKTVAVVA